jgi:hypothetical protein
MPITPETIKSWLDIAVQVIILIIPALIAWFLHTFVRSSASGNAIAAISRVANAAIDYVENLDKRGELQLTPDMHKGAEKLRIASNWLEAELKRTGVSVSEADAQKWVTAEFQRRVGDVRPFTTIAELAQTAVRTIQNLDRYRLLTPPTDADRPAYLAGLAADWLVAQLAAQKGATIGREEALTWVRAEFVGQLQQQLSDLPQSDRLARLAESAAAFLDQLKISGRLANTNPALHSDIATAWLLTEATREGLEVDGAQIVAALEHVLHPQLVPPTHSNEAQRGTVV